MKNDMACIAKRRMPFGVMLVIGIIASCIVANILALVYQFGGFTTWKSLPSPPSKTIHIFEADPDNLWIETSDGLVYSLTFYCPPNDTCQQWVIVKDPSEIKPMHFYETIKGTDCESLNQAIFPRNPFLGKVSECVLAPAYGVPDPEAGYETYFALMTDSSLRYWRHGSSILGFYFLLVVASIGGPLVSIVGISAFYSMRFGVEKIKRRANNACTRRVGVAAFSSSILGLRMVPVKRHSLVPPTRG